MMTNIQIATAISPIPAFTRSMGSIDRRIRAFLSGESHGEDVLCALYGHVADEPLPERIGALLRR